MSNTINITKCDNELILFAVNQDATDCYEICNIKSGNNNGVDVTINLESGSKASTPITANGVNKPIKSTNSCSLPAGKYTLLYSGLNWGGPYNFQFTFNGVTYELLNDPSKPLFGVIWNRGNNEIQFEIK
jgi:hypothetical protein